MAAYGTKLPFGNVCVMSAIEGNSDIRRKTLKGRD